MLKEKTKDSLVILVHGTYAASPDDSGDAWWQVGSPCWNALQERMPKGTSLPEAGEVFHWSGENSERARRKASIKLLDYLLELESSGRSYHLIGHSHGGSVIWSALRLATHSRKSLNGLGCWTTVGTPFLHHSSRSPWHIVNLLGALIGLALLRPAYSTTYLLAKLLWDGAHGQAVEIIAKPAAEIGYMAVLRAPFIAIFEWAGGSVENTSAGIRLGSFDPSGDISMMEYFCGTREGILFVAVVLLCIYVFLHVSVMCIRPVIDSLRIRTDLALQKKAFRQFGSRWLGLWSKDDEAINGLRATLDLSLNFVKQIEPTERVYLTDNFSLLSRPYYWLLGPVFNRVLRPVLDSLVSGLVIRSAQGNDRPTSHVVAVLPTPVMSLDDLQPLPGELQAKILAEANRHASDIAPKLRQLLGCSSFTSGMETFSEQLSGNELVHTSYFDHGEVLDLMALHISLATAEHTRFSQSFNPLLVEWLTSFKSRVNIDRKSRLTIEQQLNFIPPSATSRRKAG